MQIACGHVASKYSSGECSECGRMRAKKYYHANKHRPISEEKRAKRRASSRECAARLRANNPDYGKAWWRANKAKYREYARTRHARKLMCAADGTVARFWKHIVVAYRGLCAYCESPCEHMDHVIPLANGGPHVACNVRPACAKCNLSKGTKTWTPRPWAAALPSEAI